VLHAMHRSTWPVVAPAVQAALTAVMLLCASEAVLAPVHSGLWGALSTALPILAVFLISAFLADARPRTRLDVRALRRLLHAARGFLLFGLTGTLALSCDYIVMSQLLQSAQIAEYNLASKTFGTILTLHSVLLAASWTPLSDRFFRGDLVGMRRQLVRLLGMGLTLVVLVGLPLVFGMDFIVRLLTAGKIEALPLTLTLGWLVYVAMRVWSDSFATAMLSCNQVGIINRYIVWQSLISVTAQWLLASRWGAPGIVLGILVSFLLTAGWILPLRFLSITRSAPSIKPSMA
jgi:O-antigen/teichoic acid export membrane protein